MAYKSPVDIANRALQHLGKPHIADFTDQSEEAHELGAAYDDVRLDELSNNLWRFATRRVILRPVGVDSLLWTPPTWASGTAYSVGAVVAYTPTTGVYKGAVTYWQTDAASTGDIPDTSSNWHRYFGPLAVDLYNSGTTYHSGEIVIVPAAWSAVTTYAKNDVVRSSTTWYVSLADANLNNAVTDTDFWSEWASDGRSDTGWGETGNGTFVPLTYPGTEGFYLSLVSGNADNPLDTGARWLSLSGTGAAIDIVYPISSGPSNTTLTSNVYRLPNGYLRQAPPDPKGDVNTFMGAPHGPVANDWVFESDYIVTRDTGPIFMRFVADVIDVPDMDTTFCEGLAARLAMDLAFALSASPTDTAGAVYLSSKKSGAEKAYSRAMRSARRINAIEIGPTAQLVDAYITCRY